ncbi:MAG: hypothetical protein RLZZ237_3600, partial [Pseudomonadota bacterium]
MALGLLHLKSATVVTQYIEYS